MWASGLEGCSRVQTKVRATGGKRNLPSGDLGRLKEEGSRSTEDEKEDPLANS